MRDCPTCSAPIDGLYCQTCGPATKKTSPVDPDWWRCYDVDHAGARCAKPGALTDGTRGADRWWCYQHYPPFRSRGYGRSTPPAGWKNAVHRNARSLAAIAEEQLERIAIQSEGTP